MRSARRQVETLVRKEPKGCSVSANAGSEAYVSVQDKSPRALPQSKSRSLPSLANHRVSPSRFWAEGCSATPCLVTYSSNVRGWTGHGCNCLVEGATQLQLSCKRAIKRETGSSRNLPDGSLVFPMVDRKDRHGADHFCNPKLFLLLWLAGALDFVVIHACRCMFGKLTLW